MYLYSIRNETTYIYSIVSLDRQSLRIEELDYRDQLSILDYNTPIPRIVKLYNPILG